MPTSTVNWLWIGNVPALDPTPGSNVTQAQLNAAGMPGYSVTGPGHIAAVAVTGDTTDPPGAPGPSFTAPFNPVNGFTSQFSFDSPSTTGTATGLTIQAAFRADITLTLPDGSTVTQVATVMQMSNGDLFLRPNPNFLATWDGITALRTITIDAATPFASNTVFDSVISFDPDIFDVEIPCFTPGTRILTLQGEVPVETLRPGMTVMTLDHGQVAIRWVGQMRVTAAECAANPDLWPVRIAAGALGDGLPLHDLMVSGQHRVLVRSHRAHLMFDTPEVMVAARHLTGLPGITAAPVAGDITYLHFLCDRHEVVWAEGTPVESLYPGPVALRSLPRAAVDEILTLFPDLVTLDSPRLSPARPFVRGPLGRDMVAQNQKTAQAILAA
jgi:hypothetical protein